MAAEYRLPYTANEISRRLGKIENLAEKSEIPTKTSELTNDSEFSTQSYVHGYAQPIGDYALKSEIPSIEGMATEAYVNEKIGSIVVDGLEVDDSLSTESINPVQNQVITVAIQEINNKLADIMYKAIAISSFTNSIGTVELGSTVSSVTLTWNTNKQPATLTLNGINMDIAKTSHTYDGLSLTGNKTYTLKVTDDRHASATQTTTITFCNRICYGVAAAPSTIHSDFVMSLGTKTLSDNKSRTVGYNAGEGQYLWYCVPARLGTCSFTDVETGLGAGLSLAATVNVTNASGYEESYYVYKSDYAGLGSLSVKVV